MPDVVFTAAFKKINTGADRIGCRTKLPAESPWIWFLGSVAPLEPQQTRSSTRTVRVQFRSSSGPVRVQFRTSLGPVQDQFRSGGAKTGLGVTETWSYGIINNSGGLNKSQPAACSCARHETFTASSFSVASSRRRFAVSGYVDSFSLNQSDISEISAKYVCDMQVFSV